MLLPDYRQVVLNAGEEGVYLLRLYSEGAEELPGVGHPTDSSTEIPKFIGHLRPASRQVLCLGASGASSRAQPMETCDREMSVGGGEVHSTRRILPVSMKK